MYEELIKRLRLASERKTIHEQTRIDCREAANIIEGMEQIVRCKDCRFREECAFDADDNFFCASGEHPNCGVDMRQKEET